VAAATAHRRLLLTASGGTFVWVFAAFLLWEKPGLGIGHFYYVAIALAALATGPRWGALAGVAATALYAAGVLLTPRIASSDVLTLSTVLRGATFTATGVLIGWFARDNRKLVEQLRVLAERDFLTGLPNTRAFEAAINRRLAGRQPFSLLLGDMDGLKRINDEHGHAEGNDALQRLAELLGKSLGADDEVARVGGDEFAVLTASKSTEEAGRFCARLESLLASAGAAVTFGWAVCPQEGENALSLYRIADERLYARKLIRGERRGTATPLLRAVSPRELAG
jgi:diguanylate cyclase (GGDEF)-like protein